jgi:hypothetical protein
MLRIGLHLLRVCRAEGPNPPAAGCGAGRTGQKGMILKSLEKRSGVRSRCAAFP